MKTITKICSKHGSTIHSIPKKDNSKPRCRKCAVEAVLRRRRKVKKMAIAYLGGRCQDCNLEDSCSAIYDFHHERDKDFGISANGHCKSWEKIKIELDKCVLLCANCHRKRHTLNQLS